MPSTPDHEILGEGRWLSLLARRHWEYVTRTRGQLAAAIVALTDDDRIVLVEQHRVPVESATIELPAGLIGDQDVSESPEVAARRELLEETGFRARELRELTRGPSSAGLTDEQIVLYLATGLERVEEGGGDHTEDITVHCVPLTEVEDWLAEQRAGGKLVDLKVWGGLHFARTHLRQR
jgi:ADP-ribose pyrophosphatase